MTLLEYGIASFVLSLVLGIPAAWLAQRLNLMDVPGSAPHKQHARATPLAGGLLSLLVFALILFFRPPLTGDLFVVILGAFVVFVFGVWDDLKGLTAIPKLTGQLLAALILLAGGVQVRFMTILLGDSFFAEALNIFITLFWVVGITNAFNMIDSMDGIVAGVGVIAAGFFTGAALLSSQPALALWSAILFGLCLGLYIWNGWASRFFLGDSGAQVIGFLLASIGILYNPLNRSPESSWIVPIMLLSIPIFDTSLVVLSRLRRRQSVGNGRRDHTYHRLIALRFRPRFAVLAVHLTALVIGTLAFITLYFQPWLALLIFFITIMLGLAFLFWLERQPTLD
jgi:UDP-GlcNAc:undecaprenyl-phosphate/decaprenyl-phosphate GlcNAc-1-phosphate transferase